LIEQRGCLGDDGEVKSQLEGQRINRQLPTTWQQPCQREQVDWHGIEQQIHGNRLALAGKELVEGKDCGSSVGFASTEAFRLTSIVGLFWLSELT
jgi:hypothetical protein